MYMWPAPIGTGLVWSAFVTKLNPAGTGLVWSALVEPADFFSSIQLDTQGHVYVAGAYRNRPGMVRICDQIESRRNRPGMVRTCGTCRLFLIHSTRYARECICGRPQWLLLVRAGESSAEIGRASCRGTG